MARVAETKALAFTSLEEAHLHIKAEYAKYGITKYQETLTISDGPELRYNRIREVSGQWVWTHYNKKNDLDVFIFQGIKNHIRRLAADALGGEKIFWQPFLYDMHVFANNWLKNYNVEKRGV